MIHEIEKGADIDVKRFYLPVEDYVKCPVCKKDIEINLGDQYLSYPTIGHEYEYGLYCNGCENEFEIDIVLSMSVEIKTDTLKQV